MTDPLATTAWERDQLLRFGLTRDPTQNQGVRPKFTGEIITGYPTIIDADTIEIDGQRHRMASHRAMEAGTPQGALYADRLRKHLEGKEVTARVMGRDKYGRYLSDWSVEGQPVNKLEGLFYQEMTFGEPQKPGIYGRFLPPIQPGDMSTLMSGKPLPQIRASIASSTEAHRKKIAEDPDLASRLLHDPVRIMLHKEKTNYSPDPFFDVNDHFDMENQLARQEGFVDMEQLAEMFPSIMQSKSAKEFEARTRNAIREAAAHQAMQNVGALEAVGRAIGAELFNPLGLATFAMPLFNIVRAGRFGITAARAANVGIQSGLAQMPLSIAKAAQLESMDTEDAAVEIAIATAGGAALAGLFGGVKNIIQRRQHEYVSIDEYKDGIKKDVEAARQAAERQEKSAEATSPPDAPDTVNQKLRDTNAAERNAQREADEATQAFEENIPADDDLMIPPTPDEIDEAFSQGRPPQGRDMDVHPTAPLGPDVVPDAPGKEVNWSDKLKLLYRLGGGEKVIEYRLYQYAKRMTGQDLNYEQWKDAVHNGYLSQDLFHARTSGIKLMLERANNKWRPKDNELFEVTDLNRQQGRWFTERNRLGEQARKEGIATEGEVLNQLAMDAGANLGMTEDLVRVISGIQRAGKGAKGETFYELAGDYERAGGQYFYSKDPFTTRTGLWELRLGDYTARYIEIKKKLHWQFESPSGAISETEVPPVQKVPEAMKKLMELDDEAARLRGQEKVKMLRELAQERERYQKAEETQPEKPTEAAPAESKPTETDDAAQKPTEAPRSRILPTELKVRTTSLLRDPTSPFGGADIRQFRHDPEELFRPADDFNDRGQPVIETDVSPTDTSRIFLTHDDVSLSTGRTALSDTDAAIIAREGALKQEGSALSGEFQEAPDPAEFKPGSPATTAMREREDFINNVLAEDVNGIVGIIKRWPGWERGKDGNFYPQKLMTYFNEKILPESKHRTDEWKEAARAQIARAQINKSAELRELINYNQAVKKSFAQRGDRYPKNVTQSAIEKLEKQFPKLRVAYDTGKGGSPETGKLRVMYRDKKRGWTMIGAAQETRDGGYSISKRSDAYRDSPDSAYADIVDILRSSKEMGTIKGGDKKANAARAKIRRVALYHLTGYDPATKQHHFSKSRSGYYSAKGDRARLAKKRMEEADAAETAEDAATQTAEKTPAEQLVDDITKVPRREQMEGITGGNYNVAREDLERIIDDLEDLHSSAKFGSDATEVHYDVDFDGGTINMTFAAPDGTIKKLPVPFGENEARQLARTLNHMEPGVRDELLQEIYLSLEKMVCQR